MDFGCEGKVEIGDGERSYCWSRVEVTRPNRGEWQVRMEKWGLAEGGWELGNPRKTWRVLVRVLGAEAGDT